jgi:hypothetical protein
MRLTKLSALAIFAISLISTDTLALNRKFHPVVNDGPQNSHLNVQTPGDDSNQTVLIKEEPGPDGQVIPAGDTKVVACAGKDANGDIDLSAADSCPSFAASAPFGASATRPAIRQALSPSSRPASPIRVPSLTSASVAHASQAAPITSQADVAVRSPALSPAHSTETARVAVASSPVRRPASAVRTHAASTAGIRWLEIGLFAFAAAMLAAVGLALLFRMGLAGLLLRRDEEAKAHAAQDGRIPAVVRDLLRTP